jgi:CheY-like chemotaxis protein
MLSADRHGLSESAGADLSGVRILVVEDSRDLGMAIKSLLEACGAQVAGPVATAADADSLIAGSLPHAALVDVHLRAGERADQLISRLHDRGVRVVVTSGDSGALTEKAAATLSKPFSEAELFAALLPVSSAPTRDGPPRTAVSGPRA